MDETDEYSPGGYDIEDFIVVYGVRYAPQHDEGLKPWDGGPRPGWWLGVGSSSTCGAYSFEEWLLSEALQQTRDRRLELQYPDEPSEEPSEDA
jgi:hypothetical protein